MPQLTEPDLKAIDFLFQAYGAAWASGDAAGCAALYAADGDAVAIDGALLRSPAQIRQYYEQELSGKYAGVTMSDFAIDPVKALTADIALMNVSWRLNSASDVSGARASVFVRGTFIVRRAGDEWRFVAVRLMAPFDLTQAVMPQPAARTT